MPSRVIPASRSAPLSTTNSSAKKCYLPYARIVTSTSRHLYFDNGLRHLGGILLLHRVEVFGLVGLIEHQTAVEILPPAPDDRRRKIRWV